MVWATSFLLGNIEVVPFSLPSSIYYSLIVTPLQTVLPFSGHSMERIHVISLDKLT